MMNKGVQWLEPLIYVQENNVSIPDLKANYNNWVVAF